MATAGGFRGNFCHSVPQERGTESTPSFINLMSELYEPREPGLLVDIRELVDKVDTTDHWVGLEEKVGVQTTVFAKEMSRLSADRSRS